MTDNRQAQPAASPSRPPKSATVMPKSDTLLVELAIPDSPAIIKIIGVGGGGCNAVAHMFRCNIPDVRFLVCNSDKKSLDDSPVPDRLQIGPGLGCGGDPEKGRELAEAHVEDIRRALDKETKMVFITAGMGGGTGTGASPIIAREAKKKGILTVGIVTTPFLFEREKRIDKALDGVEAIAKEVDALLVINNQRLCDIYSDLSVINAFAKADDTLRVAAGSIVEIISMHGRVGLDFCDVCTVLRDGGISVMSTGYGEGEGRVLQAIRNALHSPLLNNNDIYASKRIILCITFSQEQQHQLMMREIDEINDFMQGFQQDVETKWGMACDNGLEGMVKVTILASGFGLFEKPAATTKKQEAERPLTDKEQERLNLRNTIYGKAGNRPKLRRKPRTYLFRPEDLDNEALVQAVDNSPTARRSHEALQHIESLRKTNQKAPGETQPPSAANEPDEPTLL